MPFPVTDRRFVVVKLETENQMENLLFRLATAETGFWNSTPEGLSIKTMDGLVGHAGEAAGADTEDGFVNEVLNYADTFPESIESALDGDEMNNGGGEEDGEFSDDHNALKKLIKTYNTKGFDRAALETLAREDWKERHEVEA